RVELGEVWRPGLLHWELGPLTVQGPEDGGPPLLYAKRIIVTPSWRGIFNEAPIRGVVLEEVEVDHGDRAALLGWLQAQLGASGGRAGEPATARRARSLPTVRLDDLTLRLGAALRVGPASVRVTPPD